MMILKNKSDHTIIETQTKIRTYRIKSSCSGIYTHITIRIQTMENHCASYNLN
jgi:hypothetical protein